MFNKFKVILFLCFVVIAVPVSLRAEGLASVEMREENANGVHVISVVINPNGEKVCSMLANFNFDKNQLMVYSFELGGESFQNLNPESFDISTINKSASFGANIKFPGCQTASFTAFRFKAVPMEARGVVAVIANDFALMGGADSEKVIPLLSISPAVTFSTIDDPFVDVGSLVGANVQKEAQSGGSVGVNQSNSFGLVNTDGVTSTSESNQKKQNGVSQPVVIGIAYSNNALLDLTKKRAKGIVFSGTADPGSSIIFSINEQRLEDITISDSSGNWLVVANNWMNEGVHNYAVQAELRGEVSSISRGNFYFKSNDRKSIGLGIEPKLDGGFKKIVEQNLSWLIYLALFFVLLFALFVGYMVYRYLERVRVIGNIPLNDQSMDLTKIVKQDQLVDLADNNPVESVSLKDEVGGWEKELESNEKDLKEESILKNEVRVIQNTKKVKFTDISFHKINKD